MKRITLIAGGALVALVSWLGGPAQAPVAHADPTNVVLFNQSICIALEISAGAGNVVNTCGQPNALDYNPGLTVQTIKTVANILGQNSNAKPSASDFKGVADFSGGQVHQQDGTDGINHLTVAAFVASTSPVTFHTTEGFFMESGASTWTCDGSGVGAAADPDCGGPASAAHPADNVVIANLLCTLATCPTLGTAHLTVEQSGVVFPVDFTVVGEPRSVSFFTLETGIQGGVFVNGALDAANAAAACPFSASLPFITKALAEAEKTVIVARALDVNGTAIAGAWFNWSVDDKAGVTPTTFDSEGILAQAVTPTLNLGSFGYGAPNILCANSTAVAGKIAVTARLTRLVEGAILADPQADPGTSPNVFSATNLAYGIKTFDVVGMPASVTLAASPAIIPCDGTSTSTVSATLIDAAGNPALGGTAVHFDVQVLGTANPIDTTTDSKGVATSTITPLAGGGKGLPVTVSVSVGGVAQPNLTQQILVQCSGAQGAGAGPSDGGAPVSGGGPSGTISPPNTGSGGVATGGRALSFWSFVALACGGALLLAVNRLTRERAGGR